MEFLEKIRNKPEEDRKKILFMIVGFLMLLIIYVWISRLDFVFNEQLTSVSSVEVNEEKSFSPFDVVLTKISNMSEIIQTEINNFGVEKREVFEREKDL